MGKESGPLLVEYYTAMNKMDVLYLAIPVHVNDLDKKSQAQKNTL